MCFGSRNIEAKNVWRQAESRAEGQLNVKLILKVFLLHKVRYLTLELILFARDVLLVAYRNKANIELKDFTVGRRLQFAYLSYLTKLRYLNVR